MGVRQWAVFWVIAVAGQVGRPFFVAVRLFRWPLFPVIGLCGNGLVMAALPMPSLMRAGLAPVR